MLFPNLSKSPHYSGSSSIGNWNDYIFDSFLILCVAETPPLSLFLSRPCSILIALPCFLTTGLISEKEPSWTEAQRVLERVSSACQYWDVFFSAACWAKKSEHQVMITGGLVRWKQGQCQGSMRRDRGELWNTAESFPNDSSKNLRKGQEVTEWHTEFKLCRILQSWREGASLMTARITRGRLRHSTCSHLRLWFFPVLQSKHQSLDHYQTSSWMESEKKCK